jgi:hypothetical protein
MFTIVLLLGNVNPNEVDRVVCHVEHLEINHIESRGGLGFMGANKTQIIAFGDTEFGLCALDWMYVPDHIGQFAHSGRLIFRQKLRTIVVYFLTGHATLSATDREAQNRYPGEGSEIFPRAR